MPIFELPFEIVADFAEIDALTPLYLQRQKQLDKYVFRQKVDEECQIAYVGYPSLLYRNSVSINKQTSAVVENRRNVEDDRWELLAGNVYYSSSPDILISKESIVERGVEKPLFYGMELPHNTVSATASSYIKNDTGFQYVYDSEAQVIYMNRTNFWDPALEDFRGITVRYRLDTGEEVSALMKNAPIYRPAEVTDVDPDTLLLYEDAPVYTRSVFSTEYKFEINGTGPFYIKEVEGDQIALKRHGRLKPNEPWLLDIVAGEFTRSFGGSDYKYKVKEYEDQTFFPFYPYAKYSHRPLVLDPRTLKLPEPNLSIDPDNGLHTDVVVRNEDGELKAAYTTSSSKIGTLFAPWDWDLREIYWQELEYSFDQANSVLLLDNALPILTSDQTVVTYVARKNTFTYRLLNLNPNYNRRFVQYDYMLYMVPSAQEEDDRTVFHLEYDYLPDGTTRITYLSQPSAAAYLGDTLENFMDARFIGPVPNTYQYFLLGYMSLRPEFRVDDILSRDARLKMGIDRKSQLEVLEKHPWVWFTKVFDTNKLEYPDKFFMRVSFDAEHIEFEGDRIDFETPLQIHSASGTTIVGMIGGIQPRVKDIQCKIDEELELQFMPERPGTTHYLYQLRDGATTPDTSLDTLLTTFTVGYSTNLSTQTYNVAALTGDFHKFYMECQLPNGNFTRPGTVFEVRIRNV